MQDPTPDPQTPASEADDARLMQRVAGGDRRALSVLMDRHLAKTVRLASRMMGSAALAEDIAQEAFIRVWKNAARFKDPGEAGAKFSTWLYRIVLNLTIDEKRKARHMSEGEIPDVADPAAGAEQGMISRETSARVRAALAALPDRQRQALVLCFYEDYSNKQAADLMGIGVKAVESLLVRARKELRQRLQPERREI